MVALRTSSIQTSKHAGCEVAYPMMMLCRNEAFKAFDTDRKLGYQVEMKFTASMNEAVEFITRKWDM